MEGCRTGIGHRAEAGRPLPRRARIAPREDTRSRVTPVPEAGDAGISSGPTGAGSKPRVGGPSDRFARGRPGTSLTRPEWRTDAPVRAGFWVHSGSTPGHRGGSRGGVSSPSENASAPASTRLRVDSPDPELTRAGFGASRVRSGSQRGTRGPLSSRPGNASGPAPARLRAGGPDPKLTREGPTGPMRLRAFRRGPKPMRAAPIFRRRGGPPRASPGRGGRAFRPLEIRRARRVGRHSLRLCLGWRRDPAGAVLIRRLIETATLADRLDGTSEASPPHLWKPPLEDLAEGLLAPRSTGGELPKMRISGTSRGRSRAARSTR